MAVIKNIWFLAISLFAARLPQGVLGQSVVANNVGDPACFEGYIMDVFCINRRTLLDNSRVETLRNPEKHSVHCLVDVGACISSGYEVLMEPKEEGGLYSRAFRLDRAGNDMILDTARAVGSCSTCTGQGSLRNGFRATINGTILEAATDSVPAVVAVTQLLDSPEDCLNGTMTMPIGNITAAGGLQNTLKIHGGLMLISWGALLPSGVIMAKLGRHKPNNSWFDIHRTLQIIGLLFAVIGWVVALMNFDVFTPPVAKKSYAHGILGMITMSMGLLQPFNALVRPHVPKEGEKKTTARLAWEILHKSFGYISIFLAFMTIVLGTLLLPKPSDQKTFQILYGAGIGSVLIGLIGYLVYEKKNLPAESAKNVEIVPTNIL